MFEHPIVVSNRPYMQDGFGIGGSTSGACWWNTADMFFSLCLGAPGKRDLEIVRCEFRFLAARLDR